jgi:predicted DNA-binding transcriptional regulator AlpA
MYLHDELAPIPVVDSGLQEPAMSIAETAAVLNVSPADVVDLVCRPSTPLPATYDHGSIGFYRSEVDCWAAEQCE